MNKTIVEGTENPVFLEVGNSTDGIRAWFSGGPVEVGKRYCFVVESVEGVSGGELVRMNFVCID